MAAERRGMSKITPPPTDWREGRRLRAWQLYETGWKQKDIAVALGVSEGAVSQWISKGRAGGMAALRTVPHPGPASKLTQEQRTRLKGLLDQGAEAFGFHGNVWTTERVAWLIKKQFGVSYHPAHCSRLLRQMKYSQQKPITRATQRDEGAIATWRDQTFPALKKKPKTRSAPSFS
jgi:transposase